MRGSKNVIHFFDFDGYSGNFEKIMILIVPNKSFYDILTAEILHLKLNVLLASIATSI